MSSKKDNWLEERDQVDDETSHNLVNLDPATQRNSVTIFVEDASESNCIS